MWFTGYTCSLLKYTCSLLEYMYAPHHYTAATSVVYHARRLGLKQDRPPLVSLLLWRREREDRGWERDCYPVRATQNGWNAVIKFLIQPSVSPVSLSTCLYTRACNHTNSSTHILTHIMCIKSSRTNCSIMLASFPGHSQIFSPQLQHKFLGVTWERG